MALHMNVRVRLDLRDAFSKIEFSPLNPLCWILVNKTNILDIRSLKTLIKSRYNISKEVNFQLYLQNYLLPDDEPIDLLRDDDLLKFVLDSHSEEEQNAAYNANSSKLSRASNEASKKRQLKNNDSNSILEEVDFSGETAEPEKRKKKKKKLEEQTKTNLEEKNAANSVEIEIFPKCIQNSRNTEQEGRKKWPSGNRDLLTKPLVEWSKPSSPEIFQKCIPQTKQEERKNWPSGKRDVVTKPLVEWSKPSSPEIFPKCIPQTKQEERKNWPSGKRDLLTKPLVEWRKPSSPHILSDKPNSSRPTDSPPVLQTEETQSGHAAEAVCNGSRVSNPDTSCDSRKDGDDDSQFLGSSFEIENKLEKKKRTRRRKKKCSTDLPISNQPLVPFMPPSASSFNIGTGTSTPNHMGKHIRFDEVSSNLVAMDTSKNKPTEGPNDGKDSFLGFQDVSPVTTINEVRDSEVMIPYRSNARPYRYKELSKDEQINSVCTNKSIILLNCFGAYPNGPKSPNHSSAVETLPGNQNTSESIVDTKLKYEDYPLLKGPPRIGDHIAFKILELSEAYCPEISQYKEGKVVKCENDVIDVQLFGNVKKKSNKGKFELRYGYSSGEENTSKATWNDNNVQICWSEMLEPRLLNMP